MLSPAWWLDRLHTRLLDRQPELKAMNDYYVGDHPLPFLTRAHQSKMRDEFRQLLDDSRANYMGLVVDVLGERLRVEGFRLSATSSEEADQGSWDIWQANGMDAESHVAFDEALVKGVSYLSVWSGDDGYPSIAVEDPMQTIVEYMPGSGFRRRAAGLKVWRDDWTGRERANVFLPEGIWKFERRSEDRAAGGKTDADPFSGDVVSWSMSRWQDVTGWAELATEFVVNPVGEVPIVPLRNRPRLTVEGVSELHDVYRVQKQINSFLFLLALAGYFGAHKQRWAVGVSLFEDDKGNPVEPFNVAIDRILIAEDKDARFGEFQHTDLSGYLQAIEQKVQTIATTTRTPRHYLMPEGQEPSGDAIKSAESGLVHKAMRRQRTFGEGLEEAMRLARLFAGETSSPVDSEVIWARPEVRSEAEVTDAAIKRLQLGLIDRAQALEDCGYSQTQIARMLDTVPPPAAGTADTAG